MARQKKALGLSFTRKVLRSLFSDLEHLHLSPEDVDRLLQSVEKRAVRLVILRFIERHALTRERSVAFAKRLTSIEMKTVMTYVYDHLVERISVEDIASQLGYAKGTFAKLLRASTGYSPHEFINYCRVKLAKELLENDAWKISTIAHDLGFTDQSHFTKVFKAHTGTTPKDFRAKRKLYQS